MFEWEAPFLLVGLVGGLSTLDVCLVGGLSMLDGKLINEALNI
jgi:hypothetical protein